MCGIGGILGPLGLFENNSALEILSKQLAHRGPDDAGMEIIAFRGKKDRALGLVHRRLAILDLSLTGHQPMSDRTNYNWLVFNGEIYNFRDLRKELESAGHSFQSSSDTEVILKAYKQWGLDSLKRLRGMFAFALWDHEQQQLILSVDRFSIKPLYYGKTAQSAFVFASELRALLSTGLFSRTLDKAGLESFLAYGSVQAPVTIIKNVHSMLPGQYLIVHASGEVGSPSKYWTIPFVNRNTKLKAKEKDIVVELRTLLEESVRLHLVSDVPVGVFLSGGIDSSSLVALATHITSEKLSTFSVTFPEVKFSEAPYSRLIAKVYGTRHTELHLTEKHFLESLPDTLDSMDHPTIDGTNVYMISQVVRETGIKAVLSGQGGDEIFAGYSTFKRMQKFVRYGSLLKTIHPGFIRILGTFLGNVTHRHAMGQKMAALARCKSSDRCLLFPYLILRSLFLENTRDQLLPVDSRGRLEHGISETILKELLECVVDLDPINQISFFELKTYLANTLLRDGDCMCMAHALEIRIPFLDHKLVEFVAKIPGKLKVDFSLAKPLLVKAMGEQLPLSIHRRPKTGFTFPWEYWSRNQLRSRISEVFDSENSWETIGLNGGFCRKLWRDYLNGVNGVSWPMIWALFIIYTWCRKHRITVD